jgi:hypothetical protein
MFDGLSKIYNFKMNDTYFQTEETKIYNKKLNENIINVYKKLVIKDKDKYILTDNIYISDTLNNYNIDDFLNKVFKNDKGYISLCKSDLIHIGIFLNNIDIKNYSQRLNCLITYITLYSEKLNKRIDKYLLKYITIRRQVFFKIIERIVISINQYGSNPFFNQPKYLLKEMKETTDRLCDYFYLNTNETKQLYSRSDSIGLWKGMYYEDKIGLNGLIHSRDLDSSYLRFKSIVNNINDNYMKSSEKSFHINQMVYCGNYDINSNVFASIISKPNNEWSPLDIIIMANFLYNNGIIMTGWKFYENEKYYLLINNESTDLTTYDFLFRNKKERKKNIELIRSLIILNNKKLILSTNNYNNITYKQLLFGNLADNSILYNRKYYNNKNISNILDQLNEIFKYLYQIHDHNSYDISSIYYFNEMISYNTIEKSTNEKEELVIKSVSLAAYSPERIQSNYYYFNDTLFKKPFNVSLLYTNFKKFIDAYQNQKELLLVTNLNEEISKSIKFVNFTEDQQLPQKLPQEQQLPQKLPQEQQLPQKLQQQGHDQQLPQKLQQRHDQQLPQKLQQRQDQQTPQKQEQQSPQRQEQLLQQKLKQRREQLLSQKLQQKQKPAIISPKELQQKQQKTVIQLGFFDKYLKYKKKYLELNKLI